MNEHLSIGRILKQGAQTPTSLNTGWSTMEEKVRQNIAVEIYTDYFLDEDVATNWAEVRSRKGKS